VKRAIVDKSLVKLRVQLFNLILGTLPTNPITNGIRGHQNIVSD